MKQTAVEWLVEKMKTYNMTVSVHNTSHENVMDFYKAIEQAKEMEKEQIIEALMTSEVELLAWGISAQQYYNKTFKSE